MSQSDVTRRSVLHIGTADNSGGAARASYRIHRGLSSGDWDSRMLVAQKVTNDEAVSVTRKNWRWKAADRIASIAQERVGLQDVWYPSMQGITSRPELQRANVVNFQNLHGRFFSIPTIGKVSRFRPAVWTLHDMWSFTGHCVYAYENEKWMTGCGDCPILHSDHLPLRYDTTAFHWRLRKKVYSKTRIHIVAPSRWMQGMASRSPLFGNFTVHLIPYGIDTLQFRPVDKQIARTSLNLPLDRQYLLFTAHAVRDNPRKGFAYLEAALAQIDRHDFPKLELLTMGELGPSDTSIAGFPVRSLGFVNDDTLLSLVHSAADVLAAPSIADNLPLTIMESMASGTPVVAFDSGGVSDLIRDGVTGLLAPATDSTALAVSLREILGNSDLRERLRRNAVATIESEFAIGHVAGRYSNLYDEVISEFNHHQ